MVAALVLDFYRRARARGISRARARALALAIALGGCAGIPECEVWVAQDEPPFVTAWQEQNCVALRLRPIPTTEEYNP